MNKNKHRQFQEGSIQILSHIYPGNGDEKMQSFRTDNSPITYYISGHDHREWVLFLHAAFVDHRMFDAQTAYFKDSYNVLAVDLIGHGQSTYTRRGDSINKMSLWIYDILPRSVPLPASAATISIILTPECRKRISHPRC